MMEGLGLGSLPWGDTDSIMGNHWGWGRCLCDGSGGTVETELSWLWAPRKGLGCTVGDRAGTQVGTVVP